MTLPKLGNVGVLLLLLGCFSLLGCTQTTRYSVSVSALASPEATAGARYVLIPGNEEIDSSDLQYEEFAGYAHRALKLEGFEEAPTADEADLVIVLNYAVTDPETSTYSYSVPQFGRTGYRSSTTYGSTTYYHPSYGITGFLTGARQMTVYRRGLGLVAFDAESVRSGQKPVEVWRTLAISIGSSGDLRRVFPYLMAAARRYLGRATPGRAVEEYINENDSRVRELQPPVP